MEIQIFIWVYICGIISTYYSFVIGKTMNNNFNVFGVILFSILFPVTITIITIIVLIKKIFPFEK